SRPSGTCNVYLSAARAMPPKAASTTELIAIALTRIVEMRDMKTLLVWGPEDSRPQLKMGRIIRIVMRRRRTLNAPNQIMFPCFCELRRKRVIYWPFGRLHDRADFNFAPYKGPQTTTASAIGPG